MLRNLCYCILVFLLIAISTSGLEVCYVFSNEGAHELSNANISEPNLTDVIAFTTSAIDGSGATYTSEKEVSELQRIFDQRVESKSTKVHDSATKMILSSPGDRTIDQVCLIYKTVEESWSYFGDPRGEEYYRFANETLMWGRQAGKVGAGDCDDFAILMASMVEAIGGATRVILACSPSGGHAYAEVYLGKAGGPDGDVERMITWLRKKYGVDNINTHVNLTSGEVWLNLDWGKSKHEAAYPGTPFFDATKHIPVRIKSQIKNYPLNPSPLALFSHPTQANASEPVTFDASDSLIVDEIDEFVWNFGDEKGMVRGPESNVNHTYEKGGAFDVILKVTDIRGAENTTRSVIYLNNPPIAEFTLDPEKPTKGDLVTFNSSPSNDSDGHIAKLYWNLGSWAIQDEEIVEKKYPNSGLYWINLTVIDDKGAKAVKSLHLRVNEPPLASFVPDRQDVNVGESIIFDATSSKDLDGEIINYVWDFGDEAPSENKSLVRHAFSSGGEKTVKLVVKDNNTATSQIFSYQIKVNHPPEAAFTYNVKEGTRIEFNASSSKDRDGKIVSYKWDFDDYSGIQESTKSKIVHNYDEPGQYNVALTVTDDKESTGRFSQIIFLDLVSQELPMERTLERFPELAQPNQSHKEIGPSESKTASSISVHFLADESGGITNMELYVNREGIVRNEGLVHIGSDHSPQAGDLNNDVAIRGFLSFSLSEISSNARIKSATIDMLAPWELGNPFSDLGSLRFDAVYYGSTLKPEDYDSIGYLTLLDAQEPGYSLDVTEGVKEAISRGYGRFQVRFSFSTDTDNDMSADEFGIDNAILKVVYT